MSFRILLSTGASKDLKKLERQILLKIDVALLDLAKNPYPYKVKSIQNKKLAQSRIRVGDYRILYDVYTEDKTIYILRIGHRKDIYR